MSRTWDWHLLNVAYRRVTSINQTCSFGISSSVLTNGKNWCSFTQVIAKLKLGYHFYGQSCRATLQQTYSPYVSDILYDIQAGMLRCTPHIETVFHKLHRLDGRFYKLSYKLPNWCLHNIYTAFVHPQLHTVVLLVVASQMMRGQAPQIFFPRTAPGCCPLLLLLLLFLLLF